MSTGNKIQKIGPFGWEGNTVREVRRFLDLV